MSTETDTTLKGARIAFVVSNEGAEEVELTEPWDAVVNHGGTAVLVAPDDGPVRTMNHLDLGREFRTDLRLERAHSSDFDGLVLPGGVANPDQLRTKWRAVEFIREVFESGKPVAVICHGPWTLVEADLVRGRTLTSWPSLQTDIRNAGGTWVDEEVSICTAGTNTLISSRNPDDLPSFCAALVATFAESSAASALP